MEANRKRKVVALGALAASASFLIDSIFLPISCDSEENPTVQEICLWRQRKRLRGIGLKPVRFEGYVENTIPQFRDGQFRQHFRLFPDTYDEVERELAPLLEKALNEEGRPRIPARKQILSTLWLLATPDSFRSVGDRFDMGKSSLSTSFMRVIDALCDISDRYIKWPTPVEMVSIKDKFFKWKNLPNVIGAIDGTDVEIKAPEEDSIYYINRKKRFSVTLQAVCDSDRRFTDCFAGFAGSTGDLRILHYSNLYKAVNRNRAEFFPTDEYIIGDKIYPVLDWLIPAYRDDGRMTDVKIHFNVVHACTRQVIERAFALLKGRWRRLRYLDMNRTDKIANVILACCVLHNMGLMQIRDERDFEVEGEPHIRLARHAGNVAGAVNERDGARKRDFLATLV